MKHIETNCVLFFFHYASYFYSADISEMNTAEGELANLRWEDFAIRKHAVVK